MLAGRYAETLSYDYDAAMTFCYYDGRKAVQPCRKLERNWLEDCGIMAWQAQILIL